MKIYVFKLFMERTLKKIDLHLHTIPTISDAHFTFSLAKLREYVNSADLDAIASSGRVILANQ